jgi:5-methylthioadenosine/S-adenosylhomocysteine deaminase
VKKTHIDRATIVDESGATVKDQTIVIEQGNITWVGPSDALQFEEDVDRIDAQGGICLPGLVNSHNHSPLMIVRGMVEDLGFAPAYTPGIPQGHWLSEEESYALSRLGVMEMMMAGATTIVDYYPNSDGLARSASEVGVRGIVGGRIMDVDTSLLADGKYVYDNKLGEQSLRESLDLYDRWHGMDNGKINVILAPHAPDTCSRSLLAEVAVHAQQRGCQVHTHLAQSRSEIEQVRAREGFGSVDLLDDIGILDSNLVAAHCIFLTDVEIARVGDRQVIVAHSPLGNARSGNIAPILALEDAGAKITLCTDSKSADMFESMRMAIAGARIKAGGKFVLDAAHVFDWATRGAAECFNDIGAARSLSVGEPADLLILDAEAPNLRPVQDAIGTAVHLASAANIRYVLCAGEVLLRDGKPTRVNAAEVIANAQSVADSLWARARSA